MINKKVLKFYQSQSPTDANKCYVSDIYATRFSLADLCRFAEAYAAQQSEIPTDEEIHKKAYGYCMMPSMPEGKPEADMQIYDAFCDGVEWLRNQITKRVDNNK